MLRSLPWLRDSWTSTLYKSFRPVPPLSPNESQPVWDRASLYNLRSQSVSHLVESRQSDICLTCTALLWESSWEWMSQDSLSPEHTPRYLLMSLSVWIPQRLSVWLSPWLTVCPVWTWPNFNSWWHSFKHILKPLPRQSPGPSRLSLLSDSPRDSSVWQSVSDTSTRIQDWLRVASLSEIVHTHFSHCLHSSLWCLSHMTFVTDVTYDPPPLLKIHPFFILSFSNWAFPSRWLSSRPKILGVLAVLDFQAKFWVRGGNFYS